MQRRNFIKTTAAGLLAGMLMPNSILANFAHFKSIGLQLYSLRNQVGENLEGSLEKIADIGYKNLEAAGYSNGKFYGLEPTEIKALVEKYGMKLTSSHLTFKPEELSVVLNAHKEAGIKYLVWPWIDKEERVSIDAYKQLAERLNSLGELCSQNGLKFGYHNHDFEFEEMDGMIPYDVLLENTDPNFVFMEIDLYWITYAGKDPVTYFEKFPGRFPLWHIKDMLAGDGKEMTEVGSGSIDYPKLFESADLAGMKEFFVEQDVIQGDGFESVKKSFDYLNTLP